MFAPDRLHSQSGDRQDWGKAQDEAIRGLPFSKSFTHYLDGGLSKSMTQALAAVRPLKGEQVTRARRQMWKVVHAVVSDGETNTEACRARLGLDDFAFRSAALNGLLMLRSALEHTA